MVTNQTGGYPHFLVGTLPNLRLHRFGTTPSKWSSETSRQISFWAPGLGQSHGPDVVVAELPVVHRAVRPLKPTICRFGGAPQGSEVGFKGNQEETHYVGVSFSRGFPKKVPSTNRANRCKSGDLGEPAEPQGPSGPLWSPSEAILRCSCSNIEMLRCFMGFDTFAHDTKRCKGEIPEGKFCWALSLRADPVAQKHGTSEKPSIF